MAAAHSTKLVDVQGKRFSRLVVVGRSERKSPAGALWVCKCDCGGETVTTSLKLRNGHTTSCGCQKVDSGVARAIHGRSRVKDRTYKSWKEMRQRCNNERSDKWRWYGGRGIKVCDRWNDFLLFLQDMGPRPDGMTIDRIDSDGNYEPSNCRWATPKQQAETNRGLIKPGSVPKNKTPDHIAARIKRDRENCVSVKKIVEETGLSLTTVYQILKT